MEKKAETAGAGRKSRAVIESGRPVISLCSEISFDKCLQILFQRQRWFLDVWQSLYPKYENTLPQIEVRLDKERILTVFAKRGKLLGLSLTAKEFSKVIVILDDYSDEADERELSMLGRVLRATGIKLGIIGGSFSLIPIIPFTYYCPSLETGDILSKFCSMIEKGLTSYPLPQAAYPRRLEWRNN